MYKKKLKNILIYVLLFERNFYSTNLIYLGIHIQIYVLDYIGV